MDYRYAFTSFSAPQLRLDELLNLAARIGYAGIELRLDAGHAHGVEVEADATARAALRQQFAAHGVTPCCLGAAARFADPATVAAQIAATQRAIDLASDIGAPLVRVFGGKIPEGVGRDDARRQIVGALRAVADQAEERGVAVCLETHDDWSAPGEVVAIMRGVDHPAVGVVWDVLHPVRTGGATLDEAFAALRPWIRHVHIHDGSINPDQQAFAPIGTGDLDHRRILALLHDAGYTGFLSGEWMAGWLPDWPPYMEYLPRELATMRRYERELSTGG